MKNWIPCVPADKSSMAMMRFILSACQDVKMYTMKRISLGERRGNNKPVEMLMNGWLNDYSRLNRISTDVPAYALKNAMREVMIRGIRKLPNERLDWNIFSLGPREGWKREKETAPTITWEEYTSGKKTRKPGEQDRRLVRSDIAVISLFDMGIVSFRGFRVFLQGDYEDRLTLQGAKKGIRKEDFLRRTKQIDFVRVDNDEEWKVNFILE